MSQMWYTSACRSRLNPFRNLGSLGGWTLGSTNIEGGLHSPFPVKITQNYQRLCTSSQEPILVRGITSAYGQRMVQSSQFKISGLLQPFLAPKPQPLEAYSRSEPTKPFGDHQDHPPTMGVGYLNRFQGRLLPYTNTGTVQDISNFMSRVGHTSSKHCLSVCPLHPWSSL